MRIEDLSQEVKDKVKQLDNAPADQKAEAIMQSIEMIDEAMHADLIQQVVAEAERASRDADYKRQLGLRNLSQKKKRNSTRTLRISSRRSQQTGSTSFRQRLLIVHWMMLRKHRQS